jgi:hypothetical protein
MQNMLLPDFFTAGYVKHRARSFLNREVTQSFTKFFYARLWGFGRILPCGRILIYLLLDNSLYAGFAQGGSLAFNTT